MFWGDSHAGSLASVASPILRDADIGGIAIINPGCPPILGIQVPQAPDAACDSHVRSFPQILSSGARTVVIAGRWPLFFEGTRFVNHLGYQEPERVPALVPIEGEWPDLVARRAYLAETLHEQILQLESTGKTVILVYPVPELGWNPIDYAIQLVRQGRDWRGELDIPVETRWERVERTLSILDSIGSDRTVRLDPAADLCDTHRRGYCVASRGDEILYGDDDHLNEVGIRSLAHRVVEIVETVNRRQS